MTVRQLSLGLCRSMPWRPMPNPPRRGRLYQLDDPELGWPTYVVDSARGRTIKLRAIQGEVEDDEPEWTREQWREAGLRDVGPVRDDPCNL